MATDRRRTSVMPDESLARCLRSAEPNLPGGRGHLGADLRGLARRELSQLPSARRPGGLPPGDQRSAAAAPRHRPQPAYCGNPRLRSSVSTCSQCLAPSPPSPAPQPPASHAECARHKILDGKMANPPIYVALAPCHGNGGAPVRDIFETSPSGFLTVGRQGRSRTMASRRSTARTPNSSAMHSEPVPNDAAARPAFRS
jgi:hypothetical protein